MEPMEPPLDPPLDSICSTLETCMKNVVRVFNVYTMNCAYFSTNSFSHAHSEGTLS